MVKPSKAPMLSVWSVAECSPQVGGSPDTAVQKLGTVIKIQKGPTFKSFYTAAIIPAAHAVALHPSEIV